MAQADVIREFLVQLGFKTDEKSLKKFKDGVEGATIAVGKLVAGIAGAALTVGAGVAAFASNMEALYFSVQKAGSSATSVKAFEKSMANFGVSAGEAMQSVQSLARWMRETPESEGFLQGLGVKTRDANGNLKETTDIMVDLGRVLKEMDNYPLARQYGSMLGLSEDAQRALMNGEFSAELEKQRERLKNSGFEQATKDAHKFMEKMRELETYIQAFGMQVYKAIVGKVGGSMDSLSDWFKTNGPMIADRIAEFTLLLLALAEKIIPAFKWMFDKFLELDKATDGWSTKIAALGVAFSLLGGPALIAGIMGLAGAMSALAIPVLAISAAAAAGAGAGAWINSLLPESAKEKIGEYVARIMSTFGNEEAKEAIRINEGGPVGALDPATKKPVGALDPATKKPVGALDPVAFFMGLGWTKAQAAGIVANLKRENSTMDPQLAGDSGKAIGIAQWHPDRQANFEKWAGKDIRKSNVEEQMKFVHFELTKGAEWKAGNLLKATHNARQAGEIVSRYYERPKAEDSEAALRGASAVQIAQTTNINVSGGDAAATGRAVAGEQGRVNQNLSRDFNLAFN